MYPWVSLVIVLVVMLLLLGAASVVAMAWALLVPPRMTDARAVLMLKRLSPGDLGLHFSEVSYEVRDESSGQNLRIAGWWIPARHPVDRTVLIVHGYSDAKVGGIAWGPMFHSLGYNILAIDLRGHGESGGTYSTAGYWERHDLNQVIDRLKTDKPRETRTLVLFGVSLGAACALAAVQSRDDVAAVILEGPYTSYREAVMAHGGLLGAPGGWMHRATIGLAEWMSRAKFDEVKPVDLIPTVPCPVMIIHARNDFSVTPEMPDVFRAALARHIDPRDALWEVDAAGHVLCLSCDPDAYRARIEQFLASVVTPKREAPCEVGR